MAHFIYPNANLYNNDPVGGQRTGGTDDFAANTDVTNPERAGDLSIATALTMPQFKAIRFDMDSTITAIDAVAVYSNTANTHDVHFFNSSSATTNAFGSGDANFITGSSFPDLTVGWNVKTGLSTTSGGATANQRYFYFYGNHASGQSAVTEVIIGNKLDLTNVTLSGSEGKSFGNDVVTSYGGIEFSNLRHEGKRFYNFNLNHVNETYKTNLETMRDAVRGSHYKFLYYDDSSYHYVRMSKDSLQFKEVAVGVYDTKISLVEQLS